MTDFQFNVILSALLMIMGLLVKSDVLAGLVQGAAILMMVRQVYLVWRDKP